MGYRRLALCLVVACAAVLAACETPPRPFAPKDKLGPLGRMVAPGPRVVLIIPPVTGAPEATGIALSAEVATALRKFDIGASTFLSTGPRYRLLGSADAQPVSAHHDVVTLRWQLVDPAGNLVNAIDQTEAIGARAWQEGDSGTLAEIARRVSPRINAMLGSTAGVAPESPAARVIVPPVAGAPGDGGTSLAAALRKAFRRNDVEIVGDGAAGAFVVAGHVRTEPYGKQQQRVRIEWTVLRADGKEVGRVNQEDTMPAGSLDGAWGPVATAIAVNGVEGLLQILRAVGGVAGGRRPG